MRQEIGVKQPVALGKGKGEGGERGDSIAEKVQQLV